ncbi:MAG: putative DNA binding domain-containing protein [Desulfobacterales bacterium]|nr:putative DNA binding domain-containing protein [Desulfobacterales bacterium]
MNKLELLSIIQCGETSKIQFKEKLTSTDSFAAEMIAMSNSLGGTILLGVQDKTGNIKGLSPEEIHGYNTKIGNMATNNIIPLIYITTEVIIIEDKKLLLVHIEEGVNKPYKDRNSVIWIKQGSDKRKVTDNAELLRLFQKSGNLYIDEMEVYNTNIEDVNKDKFREYYKKEFEEELEESNLSYEQILKNIIIIRNNKLTLGGLLFFGKNPQKFKPAFCIKAVSFFGNEIEGTEYRDSKDIKGTIPEIFDKGMSFFTSNLHWVQKGQDFNSIGILEISKIALEELLQNALVHRDYSKNAPVRLLIFDNRVEIISPGRLPNSLTIENIKSGNAVVRNNLLSTFCSKIMKYRGLGSGVKRAVKEQPNIKLINDVEGEQFIAIIPRKITK